MSCSRRMLVTGGTGFLGSALVRRLVREGHQIRVLDNNWRGVAARLADVRSEIELFEHDIRDANAVERAAAGVEAIWHLASVNGTENFYRHPQTVLDVGVRGMINVIDAVAKHATPNLFVASSSEVYQHPPCIPTAEDAPLSIPDPMNPRYSYAGAKIISELMAIHWASIHTQRVIIFRPHNVYGPDMGNDHVIPQFAMRMIELSQQQPQGRIDFPIEGSGTETRSFVHVDDFIDALLCLDEHGRHREIYHVGTEEQISIARLATEMAKCFGRQIRVVPGTLKLGGTPARCPDIAKIRALGFDPRVGLTQGLEQTVRWYRDNADGYHNVGRRNVA